MDALFDVEEALFTERRGPSVDLDADAFESPFFSAA